MTKNYGNYDKAPVKHIPGYEAYAGYDAISAALARAVEGKKSQVIVLETYTEVDVPEILEGLKGLGATFFNAEECMVSDREYQDYIRQYLTDDRVFGIMNTLNIEDFYWADSMKLMRQRIAETQGIVVVYGVGASLITQPAGGFLSLGIFIAIVTFLLKKSEEKAAKKEATK